MSVDVEAPLPRAAGPRIARVAVSVARPLLGLVLLIMVALNVVNAVCRYLFGIVFTGADEVLVFMMIWLVMLGLILVTASRRNIALDFLANRLGPRSRLALAVIQHSAMVGRVRIRDRPVLGLCQPGCCNRADQHGARPSHGHSAFRPGGRLRRHDGRGGAAARE